MISFVVAISQNNIMGKNNRLPWHLPSDSEFFRNITLSGSKTMIMGRKTFESLPKILPGRKHVILTREKDYHVDDSRVTVVNSVAEIMDVVNAEEEYFVIGGAEIFKMFFPFVQKIYLTVIHEDFAGDTYFPEYDRSQWVITSEKPGIIDHKNIHKHTFYVLERVKKKQQD